jgi:hypothetical protein
MAIIIVTPTTIIIIVKIIWPFLFLNRLPKDQSKPEPTKPGSAVSVLSNTISAASSKPCSFGFNSIGSLLEQFE